MSVDRSQDDFQIEQHGEVTLITMSPATERMDPALIDQVATLLLDPLRRLDPPLVVMDLARIEFFGSAFLGLLLRCWKLATVKGGMMVLCSVSPSARDLLRITSLDMVWPIYPERREAIEALLAD